MNGRRVFVKALGPEPPNPDSPAAHRREAKIAAALPPDVPAPPASLVLRRGGAWLDRSGFGGRRRTHPRGALAARRAGRVLDALAALAGLLTPSSLPQTTVGSPSD
jgi:hypothetical protein